VYIKVRIVYILYLLLQVRYVSTSKINWSESLVPEVTCCVSGGVLDFVKTTVI